MKLGRVPWILVPGILWAQPPLPTGADTVRAIREITLDPAQCYIVRDLSFSREDLKFYFNDGLLVFSRPVAGGPVAAVFAGGEDAADGEFLLQPPRRDERLSLAKFTRTPNLDEHFHSALLTFTDDSAEKLMRAIAAEGRGQGSAEDCGAIGTRWNPALQRLGDSLAQRMAGDLLSPARIGGGFLFVAVQSNRLGDFDVIFDPAEDDQVLVGQLSRNEEAIAYDVWTSFPSRTSRQTAGGSGGAESGGGSRRGDPGSPGGEGPLAVRTGAVCRCAQDV
ncbi:MAG: hypothetical protein WDO18_08360 [Acidobacteriota bacterium]